MGGVTDDVAGKRPFTCHRRTAAGDGTLPASTVQWEGQAPEQGKDSIRPQSGHLINVVCLSLRSVLPTL